MNWAVAGTVAFSYDDSARMFIGCRMWVRARATIAAGMVAAAIGYGIGSGMSASLRRVLRSEPSAATKRIAWRVLVATAVVGTGALSAVIDRSTLPSETWLSTVGSSGRPYTSSRWASGLSCSVPTT